MLSPEQLHEFASRGVVRLRGAFPVDAAREMEERLWRSLARRFDVDRDDPATWKLPLGLGLQGLKGGRAIEAIGSEAVVSALDDLLGRDAWIRPRNWGQFLVTFPAESREPWTVPSRLWHTDFPYRLPTDRPAGVLMVSVLNRVPHGHGATLVVAGSHRVVERFVTERPHVRDVKMKVARTALLASDPWLKALSSGEKGEDRVARFLERESKVGGVPVRVVELTGEPGDVWLCHPWTLHTGSPNCGDAPRFMRVQRIRLRGSKSDPDPETPPSRGV